MGIWQFLDNLQRLWYTGNGKGGERMKRKDTRGTEAVTLTVGKEAF